MQILSANCCNEVKNMKKKSNAYSSRLFWLSFLSAAILLTLLFGIFRRSMLQNDIPTDNPLTDVKVPAFTAADNINYLVIYDADLTGKDLFSAAVCCNAASKIISCCELDLRLTALAASERRTLAEHYLLRGTKGLLDGTQNLLHAEFDAFIRCDRKSLSAIVNVLHGVLLQPDDLSDLSTPSMANAFVFLEQFDVPKQREILFYRLIQSVFANTDAVEHVRETLFRRCDTSLTAYDAALHQNTLRYLIDCQRFSQLNLPVLKITQGKNPVILPNPDSLTILQNAMQ